jgi:hypothetical protein
MPSRARFAIVLSMFGAASLAPAVAEAQVTSRSSTVEVFVAARRSSGLGLSVQIDRAFGWSRSRTQYRAPTVATANIHYFFGDRRVQPYITAGMSTLWSDDVGFGPNLGAGFRADAGDRWSLGPDIQRADGTWLSRSNLDLTRFTMKTGFRPR